MIRLAPEALYRCHHGYAILFLKTAILSGYEHFQEGLLDIALCY